MKTKKEIAIQKDLKSKKETKKILANIKKAEIKSKVVVTPKTVTTTTADNATIKIVKEIKRENKVREKNFIYKFQLDDKLKLNAKQEKRMRGKLRRQMQSICNDIIIANAKKKDLTKIKSFLDFYKANYILNDLTLQSITNSADELKQQDINKVLSLAKEYKEKK